MTTIATTNLATTNIAASTLATTPSRHVSPNVPEPTARTALSGPE